MKKNRTKNSLKTLKVGKKIRGEITDIAFGGNGILRFNGVVVFIPGVISGEIVEVQITKIKSNFLEAKLITILQPSIHRVIAPCPVFLKCGGCVYQHIHYSHQLVIKKKQLRDILKKIGTIHNPPINDTIASRHFFYYRNRIRVHAKNRKIGFFATHSNDIIPINSCYLASQSINDQLQLLIQSKPQDGDFLLGEKENFWGFRQVNNSMNTILQEVIFDLLELPFEKEKLHNQQDQILIDAYSGIGSFAHMLQPYFKNVIGIERSQNAISYARDNAHHDEKYILGSVEEELPLILESYSSDQVVLLIDPPRTGLSSDVVKTIQNHKPCKIVYVSCNPTTLARDIKFFATDYRIEKCQPVDMFPQTSEIETAVLLKKI